MFFKKKVKLERWQDLFVESSMRYHEELYFILANGSLKTIINPSKTEYTFEGWHSIRSDFELPYRSGRPKNHINYRIAIVPIDKIKDEDLYDDQKFRLLHIRGYLNFNFPVQPTMTTIVGQLNLHQNEFDDLITLAKLNDKFTLRLNAHPPTEKQLEEAKRLDPIHTFNPPLVIFSFQFEDWSNK
tara:strand:+ start:325 stop:879 length:555 start_codon:yes stop_codon:yes gene_type:complete